MTGKNKIIMLEPALEDLDNISNYYLKYVGENSSRRIRNRIRDTIKRLEDFPQAGSYINNKKLKKKEYRFIISEPYLIFYKIFQDTIYIYHIANWATDYSRLF